MAPGLNVLYVCKAVDETHPALANQVRWIRSLAANTKVDTVRVLTPKHGPAQFPPNVNVLVFGARPPFRFVRASLRFYRQLLKARRGADFAFVSQGGPYPALLLPWKVMSRRPIYQWKAMPHVSARMRFYARWCDDLIFTATPGSFPMQLDKVRVIGHGIDTDLFRPGSLERTRDLIVVTRIAPIKGLHQVVRALAECRRRFGVAPTLDIVGPCDSKSESYRRSLIQLVADLGLQGSIGLLGSIDQHKLPELIGRYRATVNFSETAFDKAAGEAMASGLPIVTSNPRVAEILPPELHPLLVVPADNVAAQAAAIHDVLEWDEAERARVGTRLRGVIVNEHGLDALFDKVLAEIRLPSRRP